MSAELPDFAEMTALVRRFMKMGLDFEAAADLMAISRDLDAESITQLISDLRTACEPPTE
ncbi:hypothetical protein [Fulvimarina manganoxydans]|uniref:hypothetical protein n=1 Tax=Fulvimarina manganoxydans TaxID=937218 RepID=UPI0009FCF322|nr:hypothetical protein [Fulvimarina manganoxydans]